jgi:hypothetical protein
MINVDMIGLEAVKGLLSTFNVKAARAIDKAVGDSALDIETIAKKRLMGQMGSAAHSVPKKGKGKQQGHGGGGLLGSIKRKRVKDMEWTVGTPSPYAPYIEFGTGDLVFTNFEFDDEAKAIASQFKGKGIRKVNIRGDSFLNYAAVNQSKKFIERVIEQINKAMW